MAKLYIVPTPIGNLEDITLRALRVLKEVDVVLAEDTRTSSVLLRHYDIHTPLRAHHRNNEHKSVDGIVQELESGKEMALISDAGTPGISDPGFMLARACREAGIDVECLPGPTAFVPAMVASGLPCDRFVFEGFLPLKKGRATRLQQLAADPRTVVIYESPLRLPRTLRQLAEVFGPDRQAAVAREISKLHEENRRDTLQNLAQHYEQNKPKGEIVIVIEGCKGKTHACDENDLNPIE
jgi:16S rRNA (cytidine1402-2'-O)-methyltransferase